MLDVEVVRIVEDCDRVGIDILHRRLLDSIGAVGTVCAIRGRDGDGVQRDG